jgi:hypothetical protein
LLGNASNHPQIRNDCLYKQAINIKAKVCELQAIDCLAQMKSKSLEIQEIDF